MSKTYLTSISKAVPDTELTLRMKKDKPFQLECDLYGNGTCLFTLAPRIFRKGA